MQISTSQLLPIVGLDRLRNESAKRLRKPPVCDYEKAQLDAAMEEPIAEALANISMQLDHFPHSPELRQGFGRILALARHSIYFCSDNEGGTVLYPEIGNQREPIEFNGLVVSACAGYNIGHTENFPELLDGSWEEGIYLKLINGPDHARTGIEEAAGRYIPVHASRLYHPSIGKTN